MEPNTYAAEVPFPLAGEGAVLRFKTGDLVRLRSMFGAAHNAKPEYDERGNRVDFFWTILFTGIDQQDPAVVVQLLRHGLKKPGGKEPLVLDWDDLGFPLVDAGEALADAITLARWGKTARQVAEEFREATERVAAATEAAADPLRGSEMDSMSSSASSGSVSEPDSDQTKPGN